VLNPNNSSKIIGPYFVNTFQCKREGFLQKIKEEDGEGCQVFGTLEVNKVAGNFHFAPGKSFQQANMHVHDLQAFQKDSFNVRQKNFIFLSLIFFQIYRPGEDEYGLSKDDDVDFDRALPFLVEAQGFNFVAA
jgi:hypothetical protein